MFLPFINGVDVEGFDEKISYFNIIDYGKDFSLDHRKKLSQLKNSTGFYRVQRRIRKKNNFATWEYVHRENGKVRTISSVNLLKLKEKVLLKDLDWFIIDLDKAEATLNGTDYNLEELV